MSEQRQHQAPPAAIGERDRVGDVAIGHDGRDRAERLAIMDRGRSPRVVGAQQHRREERAAGDRRLGVRIARDDTRACGFELGDLRPDILALAEADQSPHARVLGARVADFGLGQPFGECLLHRIKILRRRHRAPDGGALLPRLDRHLGRHFLDEQVELGRARRRVGTKQRRVQAVLLGHEPHGFANDGRMRLELQRRVRRAGEADHVLPGQMIEQVADTADDQLDRAGRQDVRVNHDLERGFGQVCGRRCGLHDRRHAGQQRRRKLLEHPPDGEVEGVDVHRRALQRRVDMLTDESAVLREALELPVEQHMRVGQLAPALGREGEERAGAALDVDPAVLARRAGQIVELIELLFARHDREAQRLHQPRTVVEGQLA